MPGHRVIGEVGSKVELELKSAHGEQTFPVIVMRGLCSDWNEPLGPREPAALERAWSQGADGSHERKAVGPVGVIKAKVSNGSDESGEVAALKMSEVCTRAWTEVGGRCSPTGCDAFGRERDNSSGARHQRTHGIRRRTCDAVCCSPSTSRLARVGRQHASVAWDSGRSVWWSLCRDRDYRNRMAESGRPVVKSPLVVKETRED